MSLLFEERGPQTKRDCRHYLPHASYMFSAAETYAVKAKSLPFLVDRESLHVRQLPFTRKEIEQNGVDWSKVL